MTGIHVIREDHPSGGDWFALYRDDRRQHGEWYCLPPRAIRHAWLPVTGEPVRGVCHWRTREQAETARAMLEADDGRTLATACRVTP
jgi:hypothetical protein